MPSHLQNGKDQSFDQQRADKRASAGTEEQKMLQLHRAFNLEQQQVAGATSSVD